MKENFVENSKFLKNETSVNPFLRIKLTITLKVMRSTSWLVAIIGSVSQSMILNHKSLIRQF